MNFQPLPESVTAGRNAAGFTVAASGDGTVTLATLIPREQDITANAKRRRSRSPDRILISQCPVEAALG
jgi:hypothetical protein